MYNKGVKAYLHVEFNYNAYNIAIYWFFYLNNGSLIILGYWKWLKIEEFTIY